MRAAPIRVFPAGPPSGIRMPDGA